MAPALVKRRKLNYQEKNNTLTKTLWSTVNDRTPSESSLKDDDDDEDDGDDVDGLEEERLFQKPGASYSLLLKNFQHSSGKHRDRTYRNPKGQVQLKGAVVELSSDLQNKEDVLDRSEDDKTGDSEAEEEPEGFDNILNEDVGSNQSNGNSAQVHFEEDDDENSADPFETHFANPSDSLTVEAVKAIKERNWETKGADLKAAGRETTFMPSFSNVHQSETYHVSSAKEIKLKRKLVDAGSSILHSSDSIISALRDPVFNYRDMLYCGRTPQNSGSLAKLACLHAVNHILKTRDRIIKNSSKLAKETRDDTPELRDQGFTRPKVLILVETRNACVHYMESITDIFQPEQQENKKRFQDAFVQKDSHVGPDKPLDFRELFEGNDDNEFRLGVKFTRKSVKYYSQFYSSDIILASPLGLRRAVKPDDPKNVDADFLSSIEMVIVDQANAMLMQNWEHVEFVFENLNLQPKQPHDCDFSRVRYWYLDQLARYLRQTIVFSAYLTPELSGLFSSQMNNAAGKVKIVPDYQGVIQNMGLTVRQTFSRFRSKTCASDPDERFKYFTTTIVPQLVRSAGLAGEGIGALIFIPSYLDFVRVRNYFSTCSDIRNVTFGSISEYTDDPSSRRARSYFQTGKQSVMLYTGRAHHFRRYRIRGAKWVIMYGIPENPLFYNEIVAGFLSSTIADGKLDPAEASVRVMFSKWDAFALERIVGRSRVSRMLKEKEGDTFDFR